MDGIHPVSRINGGCLVHGVTIEVTKAFQIVELPLSGDVIDAGMEIRNRGLIIF